MIETPFLKTINATFFSTPSVGSSVPAIDDKHVYCAAGMSEDGQVKGVVVAFDKSSLHEIWRTELSSGVGDSAIKIYDGLLYVCNNNGPVCLNCETGEIVWEQILTPPYSALSFQEISPSVAHDGVFVGSPFGVCYRLNRLNGQIIHAYDTGSKQVFYGAPLLFNNYSYWASMDGNFYSIARHSFELNFHVRLKFYDKDMSGCFAEPRIAFNEIACLTTGGEIALVDFNGNVRCADKGYSRFIAASAYVDARMLVADLDGNVKWLIENLSPVHSINVYGQFLFGTPQIFGSKVIVTTYGDQTIDEKGRSIAEYSFIYVLERGEIIEAHRIPIRMHALASVQIDYNGDVFAQLTGFVGDTSSKFCAITRIELDSLKAEYKKIQEKKAIAAATLETKSDAEIAPAPIEEVTITKADAIAQNTPQTETIRDELTETPGPEKSEKPAKAKPKSAIPKKD